MRKVITLNDKIKPLFALNIPYKVKDYIFLKEVDIQTSQTCKINAKGHSLKSKAKIVV